MIQEAYVSFEISKLLKEKGFDEVCLWYYQEIQISDVLTWEAFFKKVFIQMQLS